MLISNSNNGLDAFSVQPTIGESMTTNKTSTLLEELHAHMVRLLDSGKKRSQLSQDIDEPFVPLETWHVAHEISHN
jgi:hypothetical protein